MMNARTLVICAVGVVFLASGVEAQWQARYRDFHLNADLASISALTGVDVAEAKTLHEQPARLQDLHWRPSRWTAGAVMPSTDPVDQIVFSFYNDRLYRLVVDYAAARTEGLTDADMIEAISAVYGPTTTRAPGAVRPVSRIDTESGTPVARWGDAAYSVVLYRISTYRESFRLILTEPALGESARTAGIQGKRLDDLDAPRREQVRRQEERDAGLAAADKARLANKVVFRP